MVLYKCLQRSQLTHDSMSLMDCCAFLAVSALIDELRSSFACLETNINPAGEASAFSRGVFLRGDFVGLGGNTTLEEC